MKLNINDMERAATLNDVKAMKDFFATQLLQMMAPVQTRLAVLEKLAMEKLEETPESLAVRIADLEDAALGYEHVEMEEVETGDMVRGIIQIQPASGDEAPPAEKITLFRVGQPPIQTMEELEQGVLGMIEGETKQITVKSANPTEDSTLTVLFKVERISRKKE